MNTRHPNLRLCQMRRSAEGICASSPFPRQSLIEIEPMKFNVPLIDAAKVSEPRRIIATAASDLASAIAAPNYDPIKAAVAKLAHFRGLFPGMTN